MKCSFIFMPTLATLAGTVFDLTRFEAQMNLENDIAPKGVPVFPGGVPRSASSSTPGPSPPPFACWSASKPVTWTGAPATVRPATAFFVSVAAWGLSPKVEFGSGFGYTIA